MIYTEKNINVVQVSNVQSAAVKELFRGVIRLNDPSCSRIETIVYS